MIFVLLLHLLNLNVDRGVGATPDPDYNACSTVTAFGLFSLDEITCTTSTTRILGK
jgi:hypothetical protein